MKFIFDLDETLVTGDVIYAVSSEMMTQGWLDRTYSGEDLIDFNLGGLPETLKNRVLQAFSEVKYAEIKEPLPEAYCLLNTLERNGHELGVVTSRSANLIRVTTHKLRRDFHPIEFKLGIHVVNAERDVNVGTRRPSKKDTLKHIKPQFYFDDAIEYCNEAVEAGIENVYLISNRRTGWNRDTKELDSNVKVIKHVGQMDIWSMYGDQE